MVKILLSAFECEPHRGSEYAVGWHWAIELARAGHSVTVLTRCRSRNAIENAIESIVDGRVPSFVYHEVSAQFRWEKRGPLHLHYILWQWQAAALAASLHEHARFDCVHHVTYAGIRGPSFMGRLGIPFMFGPVGGGEQAPWRLRIGYHLGEQLADLVRNLLNLAVRSGLLLSPTLAAAAKIYVTSRETLNVLPRRYRKKAAIELAIASDGTSDVPWRERSNRAYRILYAGRFHDYKGMFLGLPAFAQLLRACPNAQLTLVGEGPRRKQWQRLAARLGLAEQVNWLPWQPHEQMPAIYRDHDIFLFPSLHDSGGFVVLEAMKEGLPVVCLNLGGPSVTVTNACGRVVEVKHKSRRQVIRGLGDALIELSDPEKRTMLTTVARQRCRELSWQRKIERIYGAA